MNEPNVILIRREKYDKEGIYRNQGLISDGMMDKKEVIEVMRELYAGNTNQNVAKDTIRKGIKWPF